MSDSKEIENKDLPEEVNLLYPPTSRDEESSVPQKIDSEKAIIETKDILKSFFPPETFEDEIKITIASLKGKSAKGWLPLFTSVILLIMVIGIFFPKSRLYQALFFKPASFKLSLIEKNSLKVPDRQYKNLINDLIGAYEKKQWKAVEIKSRNLLFNPELKNPDTRKWLYQIRMETLLEMGKWVNVEGTAINVLREFPNFNAAHYYLAFAAEELKDFSTAASHLSQFQASLTYPIPEELEKKILWLELKILLGTLNFEIGAKLDPTTNLYHYAKADRVFDLFEQIEKKHQEQLQPLPEEYISLKLNFYIVLRDFLSGSLFSSSKSVSIKGRVFSLNAVRREISLLQKRMSRR